MGIHPKMAERATVPRYRISEAAKFIDRQPQTVRRWTLGHTRMYQGEPRNDPPLIAVDGDPSSARPLSFLNLLELRFLASYRKEVPLQSIRRALDWAGTELKQDRPLLTADFKVRGRDLFLQFAEQGEDKYFVNASRRGQLAWTAWPDELGVFMSTVDYDEVERAAFRWWPLGRQEPVVIDTLMNAGHPSTFDSGVRTSAIVSHTRDGTDPKRIADEVGASTAEVYAALRFERIAA